MEIVYLISVDILKNYTSVHTNVDEKLIYPEIKAQQDIYIKKILGSNLFYQLIDKIDKNALSGKYLELQENYIIPCLCNYVLAELPESLNYQFWNRGLVQNNSNTVNNISVAEMFSIMSKYKSRSEHYANEMVKFIKANLSTFTEYKAPITIDGTTPDSDSFECPIFL